ncbi:glycine--tRNA ligase [Salinisphaera sp. PC39]|uniref:glycine--tRNA ligase subunit beta n=1 Tax=Salinisphaera sp. PC39 TaxID=1304156 RepID=UPI003340D5BF
MTAATLLLEIGTEELPPKALDRLARALADGVASGLDEAGVDRGKARALSSPRRLAVLVEAVAEAAADRRIERLGPPVASAYDADGNPTKAAEGFARSCGVDIAELETRDTDKGERLAYAGTEAGRALSELLPEIAAGAARALPVPKRMRWGDSETTFVRPVHWVTALHGDRVIELTLFDCRAGRVTRGHRFHHPEPIELPNADDYIERLRNPGYVLVDPEARREAVREQVAARAGEAGGRALVDDDLLAEVCALVEWPVALAGRFEDRFLALPREVLISTLEGHQRYFPVEDDNGSLLPAFVTVANIESREPQRVIAGNERVVRPRLADALFFWEQDRRQGLAKLADGLARVTFQRDLGSLAAKSERVAELAGRLAGAASADADAVARAATLAKADLLTEMVGEFPELQGTMGRYYALEAGEPENVAIALEEQYLPRAAGGPIPATPAGRALALADKLDTLAGIFALGKRPSGEKDPFALRRAALGVLRISIEGGLSFGLRDTLAHAVATQPVTVDADTVVAELVDFHRDRLRAYYAERGIGAEAFEAVAAHGLDDPRDFDRRLQAIRTFMAESAARTLCAAHKRVRNILKDRADEAAPVVPDLLVEPAERALHADVERLAPELQARSDAGEYTEALRRLAELGPAVDAFFDDVLVMAEDDKIRENRLALLAALDTQCRAVADISRLPVES